MLFETFLYTVLLFIYFAKDSLQLECRIPIDTIMSGSLNYDEWPLVLNAGTTEFFTLEPHTRDIVVEINKDLRLACPGDGNHFTKFYPLTNIITVTCIDNQEFYYNNNNNHENHDIFNFYDFFSCKAIPESSNRLNMGTYEIGFQITATEFVPLIWSTYNGQTENVMSTYHIISRYSQRVQTTERIDFRKGSHPVLKIDDFYKQSYVSELMDRRIGVLNRQRYFTSSSYLARGHFAAKADFPFAAQQKATFYHLNCFPQFQPFNRDNWFALEDSIRRHDFLSDLETFTYVEDILYLPNAMNQLTTLFLKNWERFPVPQKVFKRIRTIGNNVREYLFVGINHPNIYSPEFDFLLNEFYDVCDTPHYSWINQQLRVNRRNPLRGLFACLDPRNS
ncbi:hypothetical protein ACKWTF_004674 [Chironomus riparius]